MEFHPLVLDPVPVQLRDRFHDEPALQREGVFEHWQRCVALGVPVDGPNPEDVLERGSSLLDRTARLERLLLEGRGVLERVSAAAARNHYGFVVADPDGVVVHIGGGGDFEAVAKKARLLRGAHWSEAMRGTNAIGTVLAADRPVFVRGSAHFSRPYQDLVCYAAPVRDPQGRIVAVVDATSRFEREDMTMGCGIVAAAHALEEIVRVHAYRHAGASVSSLLTRSLERMDCPVALVEASGRLARVNRLARGMFDSRNIHGSLGTPFHEMFGFDFEQLRAFATSSETIELLTDHRVPDHRMRFELLGADGADLAVLVFFEPVTSSLFTIESRKSRDPFEDFFVEDSGVLRELEWARRIASTDLPVMLLAETGAGKELVAQGIHRASTRASGPFVALNSGSISASLLESELFGYAPAAFTGADKAGRQGHLAAANGGTLFLDEVAEMSLAMQASLLRFLETGEYFRVGESTLRFADVRVVCATCRDVEGLVASGAFRQDLYYRLKGARVTLPPLRERTDIVSLAHYLLADRARRRGTAVPRLSEDVASYFAQHAWPGNVRELESTIEIALLLAGDDPVIEARHLPPDVMRAARAEAVTTPSGFRGDGSLAEIECEVLRRTLATHDGNVSRVARELGVARSTVYRMMRKCANSDCTISDDQGRRFEGSSGP
ncbi:MAG: sigma 54-interacting transcriptional regulator [Planctomycetes bacterium]|nr:sigma 54-interacting transcriptional regulator [Planctomycetota bacterium]MCB9920441.1 sigma 54-interacting transcriptional regulator [Planctomycetota bacterium]